jgi:hypothetical protein
MLTIGHLLFRANQGVVLARFSWLLIVGRPQLAISVFILGMVGNTRSCALWGFQAKASALSIVSLAMVKGDFRCPSQSELRYGKSGSGYRGSSYCDDVCRSCQTSSDCGRTQDGSDGFQPIAINLDGLAT